MILHRVKFEVWLTGEPPTNDAELERMCDRVVESVDKIEEALKSELKQINPNLTIRQLSTLT